MKDKVYIFCILALWFIAARDYVNADPTSKWAGQQTVVVSSTAANSTAFDPRRGFRVMSHDNSDAAGTADLIFTVQELDTENGVWVTCEDIAAITVSDNGSEEVEGTFPSKVVRLVASSSVHNATVTYAE